VRFGYDDERELVGTGDCNAADRLQFSRNFV
jgi:hypothetical protein